MVQSRLGSIQSRPKPETSASPPYATFSALSCVTEAAVIFFILPLDTLLDQFVWKSSLLQLYSCAFNNDIQSSVYSSLFAFCRYQTRICLLYGKSFWLKPRSPSFPWRFTRGGGCHSQLLYALLSGKHSWSIIKRKQLCSGRFLGAVSTSHWKTRTSEASFSPPSGRKRLRRSEVPLTRQA